VAAVRRRSLTPWLLVAALAGLLLRGALAGGGGRGPAAAGGLARVVRVVDGDTIAVRLRGRDERVRYIGIDTPESVKPGVPVQCYAKRASAANARMVAGQTVRLVVGAEPRDRYGRLLAYVYVARSGRFVNAELVRDGYARTLTIPPNDRFAPRFAALARRARVARRGLWGSCPME
jgi:micrococcal nuclease